MMGAVFALPGPTFAQQLSASTPHDSYVRHSSALAVYYGRGMYGQEFPTHVRYLPYTHEVSIPGWRFKGTVPVLEIDGPGNVLIDIGSVSRASTGLIAERGVGDLVLSVTRELPAMSNKIPFIDFTVDLKLPSADEARGLGTGRPEAGVQLDLYQNLGSATLFAAVGYRYRHRSPVFEGLKDSINLSLGISRLISERWQSGLIYDFRQAASSFSGETHEVLPYLSWTPSQQWSLMIYIVKGFTDDSADRAAGVQMTRRW
jgi:hypothetical protein